ncbi:MAG TPA: xanthine dehydrogenase family protein subunit M [Roseiarcus sp.]|jgi:xanthine dehydrogenase YagS FAD-binding subunit
MRPFVYQRPEDITAVAAIFAGTRQNAGPPSAAAAQFIAGGTTILDLMKLDVMQPETLIDISRLDGLSEIEERPDGLRLGALARMDDVARHPSVTRRYPVIAESLDAAASPQLRNMATLGGNVLQRTRCTYFRDTSWSACNKRAPGSGCAAMDGFNRAHAVLGVSSRCIATYPGDLGQALIALDAVVETRRQGAGRTIPFAALHRQPGERPDLETTLEPDEMIVGFFVPAGAWTRRSHYVKIRDRESYEFALASAAIALDMPAGGPVRQARIALGGLATTPWRAREAEAVLTGKPLTPELAEEAGDVALRDARGRKHNAFKIALGRQTVARALLETAAMEA